MNEMQKYSHNPAKINREDVIEKLKFHCSKDNLEIEEFEERLNIAMITKDNNELLSLLNDLPEIKDVEKSTHYELDSYYTINKGDVPNHNAVVCIFSGALKKGAWKPPRYLHNVCIFGGAQIDLRKAKLPPGVTTINAICIFGGTEIIIPPGVNVEGSGIGIFGGFNNKSSGVDYPDAPTIRINGVAIFGGVDVKIRKYKEK